MTPKLQETEKHIQRLLNAGIRMNNAFGWLEKISATYSLEEKWTKVFIIPEDKEACFYFTYDAHKKQGPHIEILEFSMFPARPALILKAGQKEYLYMLSPHKSMLSIVDEEKINNTFFTFKFDGSVYVPVTPTERPELN